MFNTNELSSWILGKESTHNMLIVAGVHGDIDINLFRKTLNILSKKQEVLQLSISPDVCDFISIDEEIPVRTIASKNGWQSIGEKELNTHFINGKSLARITIIKTKTVQYIMLCAHHIIGDGFSALQFLLNIITKYNLTPILDKNKIEGDEQKKSTVWPKSFNKNNNSVTRIKSINFDKTIVDGLLKHSKDSGSSLNSYLSEKILLSMYETFDLEKTQVSFPVNLRKERVFTSACELKFLTSWINFTIEKPGQNSKDALHHIINRKIRKKLKDSQHIHNIKKLAGVIKHRKDDRTYADGFASKESSIFISNAGDIDYRQKDDKVKLKLAEIHMSVSAQLYMGTPDSFTIQITMLNSQSLYINVNYPHPLVDENKINIFLETLNSKITSLGKYSGR
jgi:hypothetical protein